MNLAEVYNYSGDTIISGTSENDRIFNGHMEELRGSSGTVYDVIKHGGERVTIRSYAGDDNIVNYADYSRIDAGTGNDTVESRGQRMNVITGKGNDSVYVAGGADANATISTGDGNDIIYNLNCGETSINSGDGDDVITNYDYDFIYDDVSIMAGSGNDTIYLPTNEHKDHYSAIQYIFGDGNDTIYGFKDKDTLQISGNDYSTMTSGNDIVINVGSGKITLVDSLNKSLKIETNVSLNKYPAEDDENEKNNNNSNGENNNGNEDSGHDNLNGNENNSNGNDSNGEGNRDSDTSATDTSYISYDDLTPEQLQQVKEKSLRSLIELDESFEEQGLKLANFITQSIKQAKDESNIDIPVSIAMDITEIVDAAKIIQDDSKSDNEKNSAKLKISEKCFSIADTVSDWKKLETFKSTEVGRRVFGMPFSIISSIFGFASNYVAAQEGMDTEKRRELEKSFVDLSGAIVSFAAEKIGENVIENVVRVATNRVLQASTEELLTSAGRQLVATGVEEAVKSQLAGKFNSAITSSIINSVKEATQKAMQNSYNQVLSGSLNTLYADAVTEMATEALTKKLNTLLSPFGPVNAGIAIVTGVVAGIDQYNVSKVQYTEDQIPTASRDAVIDAAATGIYEAIHKYTFEVDDILVQIGAWIGSALTGKELFDIGDYADNWVELIARDMKYRFFGEFAGTDKADILMSFKDSEMIYGGYGNDHINNYHSNMTIYGGADCDTVISNSSMYNSDYGGTAPTDGTHNNYIDLGFGNDSLEMYDYNSTVCGGNGNDTLRVFGKNYQNPTYGNKIYGDSGNDNIQVNNVDSCTINGGSNNDYILLQDSSNNVVWGGTGNDYIELKLSNNNVLEYGRNFGNDVIVGYNSSDTIKFGRLINGESYSTVASGNDLLIYVGDNIITLKDANGQQLNIEANYIPSKEDLNMKNLIAQKQQIIGNLSVVRSLGGDLRLCAGEEEISVENIRDNFIDVTDSDGNTTAQVYMARAEGGEIAGNALGNSPDIFKVIVGASENKNHLIASDSGSSLFGGKTDDILQGGSGQDYFSYESGNDTITNYETWEGITFSGTYQNWTTDGNDLVINSAEGSLRITDAKDKLVELKAPDGKILAHICMPGGTENFDGSTYNEFVVAVGADNESNQLMAGNSDSSLWGGGGKNSDTLYGGAGADTFIYNYGNGSDAIFNADYQDTVMLNDITFEQIIGAKLIPNRATFMFNDYGSLNISGEAGNFIIGGQPYNADYQNNQFHEK